MCVYSFTYYYIKCFGIGELYIKGLPHLLGQPSYGPSVEISIMELTTSCATDVIKFSKEFYENSSTSQGYFAISKIVCT